MVSVSNAIKGWLLTGVLIAPAVIYNSVPAVHNAVNFAIASRFKPGVLRAGVGHLNTLSALPLKTGDLVGGLRVSSAFGPRERPCPSCSHSHNGVDIAAPVGTPVYAPAIADEEKAVRVSCYEDAVAGLIAVVSADAYPSQTVKLLHLSACEKGTFKEGEAIAASGDSGSATTGPHLHIEQIDRLGKPQSPDAGLVSWLLTGDVPSSPQQVAIEVLTDEEIICAVGAAEGTRDRQCKETPAYAGHTDPGNGAANLGTFSYQHAATSAADADRKQLQVLRAAEKTAIATAAKAGVVLSKLEMLSILDQDNQAPAAAFGKGGTLERIIEARTQSYKDPSTDLLDAPGLGNDIDRVREDQARRTRAIADSMQRRRADFLEEK